MLLQPDLAASAGELRDVIACLRCRITRVEYVWIAAASPNANRFPGKGAAFSFRY